MNRRTRTDEVEMVATEFHPSGRPAKYEVVRTEQAPIIGVDDAPIIAPMQPDRLPRVQRVIEGSPVDEARGFNIRVSTLALVLGGGAVLAALVFGASLSFWSALMWFGTVFALVWAGAFALDAMTSAGGVELFHAWRLWAFLFNEQRFRHNRYSAPLTERERMVRLILLAVAMGWTVFLVVGMVALVASEQMPVRGGL